MAKQPYRINWRLITGLFISALFFLDVLLIMELITEFWLVDFLANFDDPETALLVLIVMVTAVLILVAPLFLFKQILKRGNAR